MKKEVKGNLSKPIKNCGHGLTIVKQALQSITTHATKKRKQTIIISFIAASAIVNVLFLSTISAQLFVKTDIYNYGSIQIQTEGVTAYTDASATTVLSEMAWGSITPGGSNSITIYIKNEGTTPLTLSGDVINWNPTNAPDYISIKWDYNGQTIAPNQVIQLTITLTVSPNISGISNFNFELTINGTD